MQRRGGLMSVWRTKGKWHLEQLLFVDKEQSFSGAATAEIIKSEVRTFWKLPLFVGQHFEIGEAQSCCWTWKGSWNYKILNYDKPAANIAFVCYLGGQWRDFNFTYLSKALVLAWRIKLNLEWQWTRPASTNAFYSNRQTNFKFRHKTCFAVGCWQNDNLILWLLWNARLHRTLFAFILNFIIIITKLFML